VLLFWGTPSRPSSSSSSGSSGGSSSSSSHTNRTDQRMTPPERARLKSAALQGNTWYQAGSTRFSCPNSPAVLMIKNCIDCESGQEFG
jgi:hypothetical protein